MNVLQQQRCLKRCSFETLFVFALFRTAFCFSGRFASAPQKLVSVADLWLLAHPDLVELPAVRAVIDFVTACAREDQLRLRG